MTEFEFNGYTYRVYLDGTVVYGDGFSWEHSRLGNLQDIRNRVASTDYYKLKSLSKESLQVYYLSKKFLQVYDNVKVRHPSEVF